MKRIREEVSEVNEAIKVSRYGFSFHMIVVYEKIRVSTRQT